jgi:hypothetical protein
LIKIYKYNIYLSVLIFTAGEVILLKKKLKRVPLIQGILWRNMGMTHYSKTRQRAYFTMR